MQERIHEEYTLIQFFEQSVGKFPDRIYLWEKAAGENVYSEARMVIVSGNQLHKIMAIRKDLPAVEKVILLDGIADKESGEISYGEISYAGEAFLKSGKMLFEERYRSVLPDDPANICYTSGTSADPKGIVLTHRNYVSNIYQAYSLMDITPDYRTLLILPWDHSFAHTAGIYCFMGKGASIASVQVGKTQIETLKNISQNIKEIKPTLLLSVPAPAANFKKNIEKGINEKGRIIEWLFRHALSVSYSYNADGWKRGAGLTFLFKPLLWFYDKLLFKKIRAGFGGQLEFFIGGGALLDFEYHWLYTGDLGYMDPDGFLYVVERFKSLLIASDGEKFSPEGMEEAFVGQSEFISQCMLYNNIEQHKEFIGYLYTPEAKVIVNLKNLEKLKGILA